MNPNLLQGLSGYAFVLAFAGLWFFIIWLISIIAGWRKLAEHYRCRESVVGITWWFKSGAVRRYLPISYRSCLRIVANDNGIRFSVFFPFRFGHPPLFIPWTDIRFDHDTEFFFFKTVRFTPSREPRVAIIVDIRLAKKIQRAIDQNWFEEAAKSVATD
jgi:hypothetical protein